MHKALDVSLIEVTTISGWPKGGCGRLVEVAALDYYRIYSNKRPTSN